MLLSSKVLALKQCHVVATVVASVPSSAIYHRCIFPFLIYMTEESILEISRNVERFTNHPPGGKSGGGWLIGGEGGIFYTLCVLLYTV